MVALLRRGASYRELFWYPVLGHTLAFYWLFGAIHDYTRLGVLPTAGLFAAFIGVGAVQFLVLGWLYRRLPFEAWGLRGALATLVVEALGLRIFPWCFGHTQLGLGPLVQVADLGGALLVSFLMVWSAESLLRLPEKQPRLMLPLALLVGAWSYGLSVPLLPAPTVELALVQGNTLHREDVAHYVRLSQPYARCGSLVIWPESAVHEPLFDGFRRQSEEAKLSLLPPGPSWLLGAYSWDDDHHIYNSAVAVLPDGRLLAPYHKRVLLPFAEYALLAPTQLSPGHEATVFAFPGVKAAPLICYEDTLPDVVRASVAEGAELLVNLANDSWFGPLGASQHHTLASFRAIESRRYLARVTNSGLTAVVDPLGVTTASLPQGQPGVLTARVSPLGGLTPYTLWGDLPLRMLALATLLAALQRRNLLRQALKGGDQG